MPWLSLCLVYEIFISKYLTENYGGPMNRKLYIKGVIPGGKHLIKC